MDDDNFLVRLMQRKCTAAEILEHVDEHDADEECFTSEEEVFPIVLPNCTDEELMVGLDYAVDNSIGMAEQCIWEELHSRHEPVGIYAVKNDIVFDEKKNVATSTDNDEMDEICEMMTVLKT